MHPRHFTPCHPASPATLPCCVPFPQHTSYASAAHAFHAFYDSPFQNALVLSMDGGGDDGTFSIFLAERATGVRRLKDIRRVCCSVCFCCWDLDYCGAWWAVWVDRHRGVQPTRCALRQPFTRRRVQPLVYGPILTPPPPPVPHAQTLSSPLIHCRPHRIALSTRSSNHFFHVPRPF